MIKNELQKWVSSRNVVDKIRPLGMVTVPNQSIGTKIEPFLREFGRGVSQSELQAYDADIAQLIWANTEL